MRIARLLPGLLLFPVSMLGCSQPFGIRNGSSDGIKTVASVGDKPLPIRSGTPDSSVRAQETEPIETPSGRGRISGRVFDEQGKPVANAKVRLAVGAEPGGKALSALTDRSGAFTLHGLRPGSSYIVIAEFQGRDGLMTGRVETEAPDADVRIGLQPRAVEREEARTSIRPARPNVAPISNVEESDEAEDREQASPRLNREDIEPPAPEAETIDTGSRKPAPQVSTVGNPSGKSTGWNRAPRLPDRSNSERAGVNDSSRNRSAEPAETLRGMEGDDDDVNPLPPALEPETETKEENVSARAATPAPLAQGVLAGARRVSPETYSPMSMSEPEVPPSGSPDPDRPPKAPSTRPSRRPRAAPANPERERPPVTWGELSFQKQPIPLDESLRKASREQTVKGTERSPTGGSEPVRVLPTALGPANSPKLPARERSFCDFDVAERRLHDFQLPDAKGRMVAFHDLDSDLVLLDFWGTWCAPCRKSIPHLAEIQKTLGGKKMQVIGIACERTPPQDRAARVAQSIKQLGINYPVLISAMDGTCPVQDAFQVQFYPTMVLLDRQGRILWREQGATDVTLARMDRFIAKNLRRLRASDAESLQARLARAKD